MADYTIFATFQEPNQMVFTSSDFGSPVSLGVNTPTDTVVITNLGGGTINYASTATPVPIVSGFFGTGTAGQCSSIGLG